MKTKTIANTGITRTKIVRVFLMTVALAGASISGQASAQSACKGLESSACGSNTSCSWVEGYERKDGRKVTSFCRTKSGGKAKQGAQNKQGAQKPLVGSDIAKQADKKSS